MDRVSWRLNYLGWNAARENSQEKRINFNTIVKAISTTTSPASSYYQSDDYRRFKVEAKAHTDDPVRKSDLSEVDENDSEASLITRIVRMIEKIFKKALDYLHQFFRSTPLSSPGPFEKDPLTIESSPPRKKPRVQDRDPCILLPSPLRLLDVQNDYTLVVKSSLSSAEEQNVSTDTNLADNTESNSAVTKATLRLRKKFNRKRARKDLETLF